MVGRMVQGGDFSGGSAPLDAANLAGLPETWAAALRRLQARVGGNRVRNMWWSRQTTLTAGQTNAANMLLQAPCIVTGISGRFYNTDATADSSQVLATLSVVNEANWLGDPQSGFNFAHFAETSTWQPLPLPWAFAVGDQPNLTFTAAAGMPGTATVTVGFTGFWLLGSGGQH